MLEWQEPDELGVHRAYDEFAMYVVSRDDNGQYCVGFFPAPGPVCRWGRPFETLDEAYKSAEDCVQHVWKIHNSFVGRPSKQSAPPSVDIT